MPGLKLARCHRELTPGAPPPSDDTAAQTSPVAEAICAQLELKPGALSE